MSLLYWLQRDLKEDQSAAECEDGNARRVVAMTVDGMFDSVMCMLMYCADVDECGAGLGPCGTNQTAVSCTNTDGSYSCECEPGYEFTDGECQGNT